MALRLPPSLARGASRHWAGILAPPYLLLLILLRERAPGGWPTVLASAAGVLAFGYAAAAYLVAQRGGDRVPGREALLVWGGVLAMEFHAVSPAVARARVVPAALCFALGYRLRPGIALPAVVGVAGWLTVAASGLQTWEKDLFSVAAMAALAGAVGGVLRRSDERRTAREELSRETAERGRSLVLPWEEPGASAAESPAGSPEEAALFRRETELMEGIQRTLEGLVPMTGAAHAAFLRPSGAPGAARYDGLLVSRGAGSPKEFGVADTYVPARESIVFRRPFLETGPEARRYAPGDLPVRTAVTGVAAAPVFRGDAVEGVLLAVREEEGEWPVPVLPLLEFAAYFVGRDIARTRTLHLGERYLLREDWYHQMVRNMAQVGAQGKGEPEETLEMRRERVYAEAVGQIRRQVGATRAALVGTSDGGKRGWLTWEETDAGAGGSDRPQPLRDTYVGWVIRTGTQRLFSGVKGPPPGHEVLPAEWAKPGERSFLVLPVGGIGGFRGAAFCAHDAPERFRKQHAEIVRDITEVMQLGLSHVERLEALTKRATTDGLTGLANRKAFLDQLAADLTRLDGRHPCAVVMADVDHFKRINDTYGHPFGDEVLRIVARVLGKAVRKGDAAGRYGGEEFVLYLHLADPVRAREGAERFRRMIRQTKFLHEGRPVAVTASFGVSCAPHHGTNAEELLKRADEALYLSKQRGRDRVTVYPG